MNPLRANLSGTAIALIAYTLIFINLVFGLSAAVVESVQTSSPMPALSFVGSTVGGADQSIYDSVVMLKNEDLIASNPNIYTDDYLDYHRESIIHNLFIIGLLIWLLYKLYSWLLGAAQNDNMWKPILAVVFAVMTLAIVQFIASAIISEEIAVPLRGLAFSSDSLVMNFQNIWSFQTIDPNEVDNVLKQEPTLNESDQNITGTFESVTT